MIQASRDEGAKKRSQEEYPYFGDKISVHNGGTQCSCGVDRRAGIVDACFKFQLAIDPFDDYMYMMCDDEMGLSYQ